MRKGYFREDAARSLHSESSDSCAASSDVVTFALALHCCIDWFVSIYQLLKLNLPVHLEMIQRACYH